MVGRTTMQRTTQAGAGGWRMVFLLAAALAALAVIVTIATMTPGGAARAQTPRGADLKITKSVSPKVVTVGERETFPIKVTNTGNRRARNVTMSDPLRSKVRFV